MTLYRIGTDRFVPVARTSFAAEKLLERKDLQRLLRKDISPLGDFLVIAEEFGDWEDSNRRIDLLCLDRDAGLVVIEIKRTDDGGHMELQAVRYAAMVSRMTLEQVVAAYARAHGVEIDVARNEVTVFLQEIGGELSGAVSIILVSADFSTELTTTVLWLNQHDLDIRCVRLRPHRLGDELLIDATQIIPLPETADYEVQMRERDHEKRKVEREKFVICRAFWSAMLLRAKGRVAMFDGRSTNNGAVLAVGMGRAGFSLNAVLEQDVSRVEMFFRAAGSEAVYHAVYALRDQIEAAFGEPLVWDERPERLGWKVFVPVTGGWRTPESEWAPLHERIIDVMSRMERVLRKPILEAST